MRHNVWCNSHLRRADAPRARWPTLPEKCTLVSANLETVPAEPLSLDDPSVDDLTDVELLQLSREGNVEAYAALYVRHDYAARRLARHLGQREDSEDVVAEAFAQIFDLLRRGKGPDSAFRAYLFTAIRHESGRRAKARLRVTTTGDDSQIDTVVPFGAGALDSFEQTAIRAAYESLPARWRTVLWHLDVEGVKPSQLAETLGLKPNSVSALVYRARSALREAYLQQHVAINDGPLASTCGAVRPCMAGVVRRTATVREQERVHVHLGSCTDCAAVFRELEEVNREVGVIVTPLALSVALGGAGVLVSAKFGSVLLAHLITSAKTVVAAVTLPVAAATVTTVAVVTASTVGPAVARKDPASSTEQASVADADRPSRPAVRSVGTRTTEVRSMPTPVPAPAPAAAPTPTVGHAPKPVADQPGGGSGPKAVVLPLSKEVIDDVAKGVVDGQVVGTVKEVIRGVNTLLPVTGSLVGMLVPTPEK